MLVQFVSQYLRRILKWKEESERERKEFSTFFFFVFASIMRTNNTTLERTTTRTTTTTTTTEKFESAPYRQSQLNWKWNGTWKALFFFVFLTSSFSISHHRRLMLKWNHISVEFNLMPCGKQTWKAFNEIIKINIDKLISTRAEQ